MDTNLHDMIMQVNSNSNINKTITFPDASFNEPVLARKIGSLALTYRCPNPPSPEEQAEARKADLAATEQKAAEEEAYAEMVAYFNKYHEQLRAKECQGLI